MIPRQHRTLPQMEQTIHDLVDRRCHVSLHQNQCPFFHLIRRLAWGFVSALAIAPLPSLAAPAVLEKVIPFNAAGVLFINTTDEAWGALSQFTLFPPNIAVPGEILLARTGLVFARDVQPWLGTEVAIVVMSNTTPNPARTALKQAEPTPSAPEPTEKPDAEPPTASEPSPFYPVILATAKDDTAAMNLLAQLQAIRQTAPKTSTHRNVAIFEWEATPPSDAQSAPDPEPSLSPSESAPLLKSIPVQPSPNLLSRQMLGMELVSEPRSKALWQNPEPPAAPDSSPEPSEPKPPIGIPNRAPSLAIAFKPGYVIVAPNAAVVQQFLDAQAPGSFLAGEDGFRRFQERIPKRPTLLKGYGNPGQLLSLSAFLTQGTIDRLPNEPQPPIPKLDPRQLELLTNFPASLNLFVWIEPEGLRLKYSVVPNMPASVLPADDDPRVQALANPNQILNRLPGVTYLTATGSNPAAIWGLTNTALSNEEEWTKLVEKFRAAAQEAVGFDDRDVLPWMDGELTFFVYPARDLPLTLNTGAGLMVQTSDRPAAEAFLKKLNQWSQKEFPDLTISSIQIKGQSITSWELTGRSNTGFGVLAYTWLDDKTLLVTNGRGGMTDLVPKPFTNLADAYSFKRAIAPLPQQNTGYFYMDTSAITTFVFNVFLPQVFGAESVRSAAPFLDEIRQVIGSIRTFSATVSFTPREGAFEAFLALGRRPTKSPTAPESR